PEAPERGALDGLRLRRERVDLDDPAEAVGLVRVVRVGQVEARTEAAPAVKGGPAGAEAVARLPGIRLEPVAAEIEVDVLLARDVRAPRRMAVRAVVQRAGRGIARAVHQLRRAGRGSAELDVRVHVDAARV